MAITYGELPATDRTRRTMWEGRPVVLLCKRCLGQFSATRGDYFHEGSRRDDQALQPADGADQV